MFLACRHLNSPDPFKKRVIFKMAEMGGETAKKSTETANELSKELNAMGLGAKALEMVAKINELEAAGQWDAAKQEKVQTAIAILDSIQKLDNRSNEYKEAMRGFDIIFEDLDITAYEFEMLKALSNQISDQLALREGHLDKSKSYVYLKDQTGKHLKIGDDKKIGTGEVYTVDFAGNSAAERTVGLATIIPSGFNQVQVTKKDGSVKDAYRRPNGSFYSEGSYVTVHTGDTVMFLGRIENDAVAQAEAAEKAFHERLEARAEAARSGDAAATFEAAREASAERVRNSFTAQEARSNFYLTQAQGLDKKSDVDLPEELRHLSNLDYSRDLRTMDYGDQVWRALENLTSMSPEKSEIDYWKKIRGDFSSENIRFDKICRVTLEEPSSKFITDYKKSKENVEALNRAEARLSEIPNASVIIAGDNEAEKNRLRAEVLEAMENDQQKLAYYRIEEYLFGERTPIELRDQLAEKEKFLMEAKQLMEGVEHLKPRNEQFADAAREDIGEDARKAEALLDSIFDRENYGPLVKVSLWNKIFNAGDDRTFNMQLYGEKADYVDRLNMVMSESAAFRELRADFLNVGTGVVDTQGLVNKLKELRDAGAKRAAMGTDVAKEVGDPDEYISSHPLSNDLLNNPGSISETDRELIRLGMALNKGLEFKLQEQEAFEALKERHSDFADGVIDSIKEYGFSAEEAAKAAERVDQHLCLGFGVMYSEYNKTFLMQTEDGQIVDDPTKEDIHEQALAWGIDGNIDLGRGVNLHIGVSNDNLLTGTFAYHQGVSGRVKLGGKDSRLGLGLGAGVQESTKGVGVGAGADLSFDLGKYRQYRIAAGGGLAVSPALEGLLGFGVHAGFDRNLSGAFERKVNKASEEVQSTLEARSAAYKEELLRSGLTAEQADAMIKELASFVQTNLDDKTMKDMNGFQFLGVGVAWAPGLFPAPYLAFSIAKKRHVLYAKPQDRLLTEVADSRIQERISQSMGAGATEWKTMYISNTSQINEQGMKTMAESYKKSEMETRLEQYATLFRGQGIELTKKEVNGTTRIQMQVLRVDGGVNVYTDPASGIQTYLGENGEIYLNLDAVDNLTIRRVDEFYPFIKHDGTQETRIYISNNESTLGSVIERDSAAMIRYVELLGTTNKRVSKPELVQLRERLSGKEVSEAEAVFASQKDLVDTVPLADLFADAGAFSEARTEMRNALGSRDADTTLDEETRAHLDDLAKHLVMAKKIDYRTLSTVEWSKQHDKVQYDKVNELIFAADPERQWTNSEITYMHQTLMVASLSEFANNTPDLLKKHMYDWNKKAMEQGLTYQGVSPEMAKTISEKIIAYYTNKEILENFNHPKEAIMHGAILQIYVGTLGVRGYREAFHQYGDDQDLVGAVDLMQEGILRTQFLMTEEEEAAFMKAYLNQVSPLPEDPSELFHSQLGFAVLDASELIFGPEDTKKLAKVVSNPELAATVEYNELYMKYKQLVTDLRNKGHVGLSNGMVLSTHTTERMGFYDKCKNFAFMMREILMISVPVGTTQAEKVKAAISGKPNVKFVGIGVAAAVKVENESKIRPPDIDEPEKPKPAEGPGGFELKPGTIGGPVGNTPGNSGEGPGSR